MLYPLADAYELLAHCYSSRRFLPAAGACDREGEYRFIARSAQCPCSRRGSQVLGMLRGSDSWCGRPGKLGAGFPPGSHLARTRSAPLVFKRCGLQKILHAPRSRSVCQLITGLRNLQSSSTQSHPRSSSGVVGERPQYRQLEKSCETE